MINSFYYIDVSTYLYVTVQNIGNVLTNHTYIPIEALDLGTHKTSTAQSVDPVQSFYSHINVKKLKSSLLILS